MTRCKRTGMRVVVKVWYYVSFDFATLRSRALFLTMGLFFRLFCCGRISHKNCFTDSSKSNGALLASIVIYSWRTFYRNPTFHSIWTFCNAMRRWCYTCLKYGLVPYSVRLCHIASTQGSTSHLILHFIFLR